jgi:hypothetical protein
MIGGLSMAACSSSANKATTTSQSSVTSTSVTSTSESSATSSPSTTAQSTTSTTASAQARNLLVTDPLRAELVAAGAASNGLPSSDYTGLRPGETYYAHDNATNSDWAAGGLVASSSSQQAQVSTQDDGSYMIFVRPAGGSWKVYDDGLGGVGGTPCPVQVPAAVLQVWGWTPGSCRPSSH